MVLAAACRQPQPLRPRTRPTPAPHSQHSSLTVHFSVSSVGSVHTEPSSGNCFTYLSRDRMPVPQEMLQGDQVIHSDMVHVEPSATRSGHCSRGGTLPGLEPLRASSPKGRNLHGQLACREIWATEDGSQRKGHKFLNQELFFKGNFFLQVHGALGITPSMDNIFERCLDG